MRRQNAITIYFWTACTCPGIYIPLSCKSDWPMRASVLLHFAHSNKVSQSKQQLAIMAYLATHTTNIVYTDTGRICALIEEAISYRSMWSPSHMHASMATAGHVAF